MQGAPDAEGGDDEGGDNTNAWVEVVAAVPAEPGVHKGGGVADGDGSYVSERDGVCEAGVSWRGDIADPGLASDNVRGSIADSGARSDAGSDAGRNGLRRASSAVSSCVLGDASGPLANAAPAASGSLPMLPTLLELELEQELVLQLSPVEPRPRLLFSAALRSERSRLRPEPSSSVLTPRGAEGAYALVAIYTLEHGTPAT